MRLWLLLLLPVPLTAQTFSPAPGTYPSTQTVTITPPAGDHCFYTTDGSTPYLAGFEATTPLTVSSTQTIKTICAQTPVVYQNVQTSNAHWKCVTPSGGTFGSLTCGASAGVGSINPSNIVWNFGTPMTELMSTTSATGTTQALFINTQTSAACTTCTQLTQRKIVKVDQGPTFLLNNEMDSNINMLSTFNQFHTASLQCNQQAGNPAGNGFPGGMQWQYDNQQGSWLNTGFTFGCPLSTTQQTEIRYSIHWANGDTSCTGGFSTDHYDNLTVCVGGTNGQGGTCVDHVINKTLCGYTEPSFSQSVVIQDQPDATNTTKSGHNPTTSTRSVWGANMTASFFGTSVTSSATYTIGGAPPGPTQIQIQGAIKFQGTVTVQ